MLPLNAALNGVHLIWELLGMQNIKSDLSLIFKLSIFCVNDMRHLSLSEINDYAESQLG